MDGTKELGAFLEAVANIFDGQYGLYNGELLEKSAVIFYEYYQKVIANNEQFYIDLFMTLGSDEKLYTMVLSVIYRLTKDFRAIIALEDVLLNNDVDVFWADEILSQIGYARFINDDIHKSYEKSRLINQRLLNRYIERYPIPYSYTPYEDRNNKRVIVETNTLLSPKHAPSYIVLEVCKSLQENYGYEVFLIVNRMSTKAEGTIQCWYEPVQFNYDSDMDNEFLLDYEGAKIRGFQFEWSDENQGARDAVLELIDRWKPLCVFHIGGASYRHDIYRYQTTLISMPCNAGFIVSEAQVLFSYMKDESAYMEDAIKYIQAQGQLMKAVENFGAQKIEIKHEYTKSDFKIPEESFAICIVGNRLNQEMSDEFIKLLEQICSKKSNLHIVIIGECKEEPFSEQYSHRVSYLGYQQDLVDVLNVMDLFVNPIRKGGGGGAEYALKVGVPVVTLRGCDVFSVVGEPFGCDDLNSMRDIIMRYIDDKAFYEERVQDALSCYEKRSAVDRGEVFYKLLQEVESELVDN